MCSHVLKQVKEFLGSRGKCPALEAENLSVFPRSHIFKNPGVVATFIILELGKQKYVWVQAISQKMFISASNLKHPSKDWEGSKL